MEDIHFFFTWNLPPCSGWPWSCKRGLSWRDVLAYSLPSLGHSKGMKRESKIFYPFSFLSAFCSWTGLCLQHGLCCKLSRSAEKEFWFWNICVPPGLRSSWSGALFAPPFAKGCSEVISYCFESKNFNMVLFCRSFPTLHIHLKVSKMGMRDFWPCQ